MQDNYEEDLSEKEKAIVREMCNVRTPSSNSWGSLRSFVKPLLRSFVKSMEVQGSTACKICEVHRHKGRVETADHCFG